MFQDLFQDRSNLARYNSLNAVYGPATVCPRRRRPDEQSAGIYYEIKRMVCRLIDRHPDKSACLIELTYSHDRGYFRLVFHARTPQHVLYQITH